MTNLIISFQKNWNNKLDCDTFTTIRLYTPEKCNWYVDQAGKVFDVTIKGLPHCQAKLEGIAMRTLKQLLFEELLIRLDSGMEPQKFYEFMQRMYGKKPEWKNENTKMLILIFEKKVI